jgi:hypothetical protein
MSDTLLSRGPLRFFNPHRDKLDELKTQLNKYFVHLDENQTTSRIFVQVPYVNLRMDKDEDLWKSRLLSSYFHNDSDVASMFNRWLKIISSIFVLVQTATAHIVSKYLVLFSVLIVA